ncbi:hypothetical protein GCM10010182_12350 [Actinomadura cremea]|nr:hypothetical protein GCM10010182_12350 [Actinomadura cremea]
MSRRDAVIVQVVEPRADGCVIRCLSGEVADGTTFTTVLAPDGEALGVDLRVAEIRRFEGVKVPALDPGHTARLRLTGTGHAELHPSCRLVGR